MALIYSGMYCPLCDKVISDDDLKTCTFVATSHFVGDPESPFWPFSDAAMHQSCFMAWPLREAFVKLYNSTAGQLISRGRRKHMRADGSLIWLNALTGLEVTED